MGSAQGSGPFHFSALILDREKRDFVRSLSSLDHVYERLAAERGAVSDATIGSLESFVDKKSCTAEISVHRRKSH